MVTQEERTVTASKMGIKIPRPRDLFFEIMWESSLSVVK
jgi:hypothetical protein